MIRHRSRAPLACLLAFVCAVSALAVVVRSEPAAATARVLAKPTPKVLAFPDGTWQGTTTSAGGMITNGTVFGAGGAEIYFELTVADGQVVDGTMSVEGSTGSNVPGATGQAIIHGVFALSGTAEAVEFEGTMEFSGSVTAGGLTVPIQGSGPGSGVFSPKTATCSKATGDLAFVGRALQQATGLSSDVTAPFVALRVKGVDADKVLAEFDALAEELNEMLANIATGDANLAIEDLFAYAQKAVAALNHVAGLRACGALPRGFQKGLADSYFADLFYELARALLARANELTPAQILTVLSIAYEMGAVGASSPDKQSAEELLDQFVDALSAQVDTALANGDIDSLVSILAAAEQLGLDELAAKADAAVDEFLESQKSGG